MNQEQIIKMQMIEQEAGQLNQQMQMIEQNISEMQNIELSLEEIDKKETKEILANLGKNIYLPVEIKDRNLIVEIGNKKFVKKSIEDTKDLIQRQMVKLVTAKGEISQRLESLQKEVETLMEVAQKEEKVKKK